jgi:uncharacterized protein (TIGR02453 family)
MLQESTMKFLTQLAKNNNKAWFDKHRDEYQAAKQDFEVFVDDLLVKMTSVDPALANIKAKDCIFRIFRDVRFSKDKTPYKAHFGAFLSKGGRKYEGPGYYIHLEPGKCFAGGGSWMPSGPLLKSIRQEIDYNFDEFKKILAAKDFKKYFKKVEGESLKTLPQGYTADNPAIEYLKLKSYTVGTAIADKEVTSKGFASKCVGVFSAMRSLVDLLDRCMD